MIETLDQAQQVLSRQYADGKWNFNGNDRKMVDTIEYDWYRGTRVQQTSDGNQVMRSIVEDDVGGVTGQFYHMFLDEGGFGMPHIIHLCSLTRWSRITESWTYDITHMWVCGTGKEQRRVYHYVFDDCLKRRTGEPLTHELWSDLDKVNHARTIGTESTTFDDLFPTLDLVG